MSHTRFFALFSAAFLSLGFASVGYAQIRESADTTIRKEVRQAAEERAPAEAGGKSMNPNTGVAGFKKELQDAKDQKRNAELTEFVNQNKTQSGIPKGDAPADPLAKNFSKQEQEKKNYEAARQWCAMFTCLGYADLPDTGNNTGTPLTPPNPFDTSKKDDKPSQTEEQKQQQALEAKKKKEEGKKQCMKECVDKKMKEKGSN